MAADEDGRARVAAAERRGRAQVQAAEAERDTRVGERRREAEEALRAELRAIEDETARVVDERRQRRLARAAERGRKTEALMPAAVDACLRVLRRGPPDGSGP